MEDITFCKICSSEINKSLLYEHSNSNEHKDIENSLFVKCMTYCETYRRGKRIDEWREHIISENHLEMELKNFCNICKTKYDVSGFSDNTFQDRCRSAEHNHIRISAHEENHNYVYLLYIN